MLRINIGCARRVWLNEAIKSDHVFKQLVFKRALALTDTCWPLEHLVESLAVWSFPAVTHLSLLFFFKKVVSLKPCISENVCNKVDCSLETFFIVLPRSSNKVWSCCWWATELSLLLLNWSTIMYSVCGFTSCRLSESRFICSFNKTSMLLEVTLFFVVFQSDYLCVVQGEHGCALRSDLICAAFRAPPHEHMTTRHNDALGRPPTRPIIPKA